MADYSFIYLFLDVRESIEVIKFRFIYWIGKHSKTVQFKENDEDKINVIQIRFRFTTLFIICQLQENIKMKLSLGEPEYKQLFTVALLSTRTSFLWNTVWRNTMQNFKNGCVVLKNKVLISENFENDFILESENRGLKLTLCHPVQSF